MLEIFGFSRHSLIILIVCIVIINRGEMVSIGPNRAIVVDVDVVGTGTDLRQIDIDIVEVVGTIVDVGH